ncbi:MAG: hypothetical protein V3S11_05240, partial [Elusimicrobiota bacterium]
GPGVLPKLVQYLVERHGEGSQQSVKLREFLDGVQDVLKKYKGDDRQMALELGKLFENADYAPLLADSEMRGLFNQWIGDVGKGDAEAGARREATINSLERVVYLLRNTDFANLPPAAREDVIRGRLGRRFLNFGESVIRFIEEARENQYEGFDPYSDEVRRFLDAWKLAHDEGRLGADNLSDTPDGKLGVASLAAWAQDIAMGSEAFKSKVEAEMATRDYQRALAGLGDLDTKDEGKREALGVLSDEFTQFLRDTGRIAEWNNFSYEEVLARSQKVGMMGLAIEAFGVFKRATGGPAEVEQTQVWWKTTRDDLLRQVFGDKISNGTVDAFNEEAGSSAPADPQWLRDKVSGDGMVQVPRFVTDQSLSSIQEYSERMGDAPPLTRQLLETWAREHRILLLERAKGVERFARLFSDLVPQNWNPRSIEIDIELADRVNKPSYSASLMNDSQRAVYDAQRKRYEDALDRRQFLENIIGDDTVLEVYGSELRERFGAPLPGNLRGNEALWKEVQNKRAQIWFERISRMDAPFAQELREKGAKFAAEAITYYRASELTGPGRAPRTSQDAIERFLELGIARRTGSGQARLTASGEVFDIEDRRSPEQRRRDTMAAMRLLQNDFGAESPFEVLDETWIAEMAAAEGGAKEALFEAFAKKFDNEIRNSLIFTARRQDQDYLNRIVGEGLGAYLRGKSFDTFHRETGAGLRAYQLLNKVGSSYQRMRRNDDIYQGRSDFDSRRHPGVRVSDAHREAVAGMYLTQRGLGGEIVSAVTQHFVLPEIRARIQSRFNYEGNPENQPEADGRPAQVLNPNLATFVLDPYYQVIRRNIITDDDATFDGANVFDRNAGRAVEDDRSWVGRVGVDVRTAGDDGRAASGRVTFTTSDGRYRLSTRLATTVLPDMGEGRRFEIIVDKDSGETKYYRDVVSGEYYTQNAIGEVKLEPLRSRPEYWSSMR